MLTTCSLDFMIDKIDILYKSSFEDFETICDTTAGSDSLNDNPASIPAPKRRRRLDRLNGTTTTHSNITSASDFSTLNNNNNNNTSTSNHNTNNQLKHERLSPGTPPDTSSRSLTPSSASHPDTPPAQDIMGGLGGVMGAASSPLLARNYSDIMRSLAAKYNNTNPNDYFSRNGFPPQPPSQSDRYKPPIPSSISYTSSFATTHLPPSTSSSNSSTDLNPTPSPNHNKPNKQSAQANTSNSSGPSITPSGTPTGGDYSPLLNHPFTAVAAASGLFSPLIDMSNTQTLLALVRTAKEAEAQSLMKTVKSRTDSPLDLSGTTGGSSSKKPKIVKATTSPAIPIGMNLPNFPSVTSTPSSSGVPLVLPRPISSSPQPKRTDSSSPPRVQHQSHEDITTWSVDDVCKFVAGIDICAEYEQNFREQSIDGSGLPLLTEEHLVNTMHMRLGPALKLRSLLAKKIGSCTVCLHCNHCHNGSTAPSTSAGVLDNTIRHSVAVGTAFHQTETRLDVKYGGSKNVARRDSNASGGGGEGGSEGEGKGQSSP